VSVRGLTPRQGCVRAGFGHLVGSHPMFGVDSRALLGASLMAGQRRRKEAAQGRANFSPLARRMVGAGAGVQALEGWVRLVGSIPVAPERNSHASPHHQKGGKGMDTETKATFRALIDAIERLSGALWEVHDLRREDSRLTHARAVLAPNPQAQVRALLDAAKGLVDPSKEPDS